MPRLTQEELDKIKEKYNVSRLWSYSRVNTFMTSPYEYMLRYLKHVPEDRQDSIYVVTGGISHNILEKFYTGEIEYTDMIDEFEDGWMTAYDIAQLKFNRADDENNQKIADKYRENLEHFFKNHTRYKYKLSVEKPVVANINGNIFFGYADAVYKDDEDNYCIVDFKSSSMYSGKTLYEHSAQLTIYAIALNQMFGIPFEKIKICFNFLKHCTIQYEQANGAIKERNVERCKIGESLKSNVGMWMKKLGYEDQIDGYLKLLIDTNSIEVLPEDVQEKYKVSDCHVFISVTQDLVENWIETMTATIKDIELREADYQESGSEMCFWDSEESVKAQSYYFANLCSYSPNFHKPYQEYLNKLEEAKNNDNIFDGILGSNDYDVVNTNKVIHNKKNEDLDLSWLDCI